ncbi:hypothetical protein [Streptomyces sp. NK15101]|uniref:hypothetical protein n=1 Tax=Streptomyces sp. NK15101 TaxID=2873261 RepID=UPI001CEDFBFE
MTAFVDGARTRTIEVHGTPTLYRLTDHDKAHEACLELQFAPGLQAFAITYG